MLLDTTGSFCAAKFAGKRLKSQCIENFSKKHLNRSKLEFWKWKDVHLTYPIKKGKTNFVATFELNYTHIDKYNPNSYVVDYC